MRYQWKTVDTRTTKGLKEAETLQAEGWYIISTGFYSLIFERKINLNRYAADKAQKKMVL